jgi:hypothetical protein
LNLIINLYPIASDNWQMAKSLHSSVSLSALHWHLRTSLDLNHINNFLLNLHLIPSFHLLYLSLMCGNSLYCFHNCEVHCNFEQSVDTEVEHSTKNCVP